MTNSPVNPNPVFPPSRPKSPKLPLPPRLYLQAFFGDPSMPGTIETALRYQAPGYRPTFGDGDTLKQLAYLEKVYRLWNGIILKQAPVLVEKCDTCNGKGECPHCSHECDDCSGRGYVSADDLSEADAQFAEYACCYMQPELDWMFSVRSVAVFHQHKDTSPEWLPTEFCDRTLPLEARHAGN